IQLVPELRAEETSGSVERFHELIGGPAAERDDKRRRVAQIGADAHLRHGHLYALQLGIAQAAAAAEAPERMTHPLANAQLPLARRPTRPSRHRFTALPQARPIPGDQQAAHILPRQTAATCSISKHSMVSPAWMLS